MMKYSVQILDVPFIGNRNENILGRDKTALIKIIKDSGKMIEHKYGVIEADQVYEMISSGREINLNRTYVRNFSLDFYRDRKDLEQSEIVCLKKICAVQAFFDGDTVFSNSCFDNHVDFGNARFGNGNVSFNGACFEDASYVNFGGAHFSNGNVQFTRARFGNGDVNFSGASFGEGDVVFSAAEFGHGNISFCGVEFGRSNVYFYLTRLGDGNFEFSRSKLREGHINFHTVKFDNANFSKCQIQKLKFVNCTFINYIDMRLDWSDEVEFEDCIIETNFNLKSSRTQKVDIGKLKLINMINLGQIHIDWIKNDVKSMIYSQESETTFSSKAEQFRLLKQNFQHSGQYSDEDKAYLEFKRCERKSHFYGEHYEQSYKGKLAHIVSVLTNPFEWVVFDKIGHYGTSPVNVLLTMLFTILTFAAIYMSFPALVINTRAVTDNWSGLYLSIETFLTIGYGDIYPANGVGLMLAGAEGFMGLFLLSYFTVTFVRKTLR